MIKDVIVLNCSSNKENVAAILGLLSGVKNVYVGRNKLAVECDEEYKDTLLNTIPTLKGVTKTSSDKIEIFNLEVYRIDGDKEGWNVNGIRLPNAIENIISSSNQYTPSDEGKFIAANMNTSCTIEEQSVDSIEDYL